MISALQAENSYPESYDLRNVDGKSYVTPVRFQNPFGTCWGFAAIAAAESRDPLLKFTGTGSCAGRDDRM